MKVRIRYSMATRRIPNLGLKRSDFPMTYGIFARLYPSSAKSIYNAMIQITRTLFLQIIPQTEVNRETQTEAQRFNMPTFTTVHGTAMIPTAIIKTSVMILFEYPLQLGQ